MDFKYVTQRREVFFEIARKYIDEKSLVLDIGAGNGSFAKYCERNDFYLYDGNKESVSELQKEFRNSVVGELPLLPFEDGFFDLIHCSHVVEHLEPQVFYDTLKEMDRCLKSKGRLVISAPMMWEGFYDDLSHVKPYNPNIYIRYLTLTTNQNFTRKKISDAYQVSELVYRYYEVADLQKYDIVGSGRWGRLIKKLIKFGYAKGLRKFEKNGYTIVLQKQ